MRTRYVLYTNVCTCDTYDGVMGVISGFCDGNAKYAKSSKYSSPSDALPPTLTMFCSPFTNAIMAGRTWSTYGIMDAELSKISTARSVHWSLKHGFLVRSHDGHPTHSDDAFVSAVDGAACDKQPGTTAVIPHATDDDTTPFLSVTLTVNVLVPTTAVDPLISPVVVLSVNPTGSDPLEMEYTYGLKSTPGSVVTVANELYSVANVTDTKLGHSTLGGGVMVSVHATVTDAPDASVTVTL